MYSSINIYGMQTHIFLYCTLVTYCLIKHMKTWNIWVSFVNSVCLCFFTIQSADCKLQVMSVYALSKTRFFINASILCYSSQDSFEQKKKSSQDSEFSLMYLTGAEQKIVVAVARNPVCNLSSMVGISEIPDWCFFEAYGDLDHYTEAPLADDLSCFRQMSPLSHVSKVKPPYLVTSLTQYFWFWCALKIFIIILFFHLCSWELPPCFFWELRIFVFQCQMGCK